MTFSNSDEAVIRRAFDSILAGLGPSRDLGDLLNESWVMRAATRSAPTRLPLVALGVAAAFVVGVGVTLFLAADSPTPGEVGPSLGPDVSTPAPSSSTTTTTSERDQQESRRATAERLVCMFGTWDLDLAAYQAELQQYFDPQGDDIVVTVESGSGLLVIGPETMRFTLTYTDLVIRLEYPSGGGTVVDEIRVNGEVRSTFTLNGATFLPRPVDDPMLTVLRTTLSQGTIPELQPELRDASLRLGTRGSMPSGAVISVECGGTRLVVRDRLVADPVTDDGPSAIWSRTDSTTPPAVPPWSAGWSAVSSDPVMGRTFPVMIWTGTEYIVWGGEKPSEGEWHDTGAAFNPSNGEWRDLAGGPLAPRSEHVAVWTGTEMIVCCGRQVGAGVAAAAYDPLANMWRVISPPPISPTFGQAVWTGTEMVVFGGVGPGGSGNLRGAAAYDPATGWRTLSDLPYGIERSAEAVLGNDVIYTWPSNVRPGGDTQPLAYHIATDSWQILTVPPELELPLSPSLAWTGNELIAWGLAPGFGQAFGIGLAFEPATGTWRPLPPAPLPRVSPSDGSESSQASTWTGSEMIVWTGWIGTEWDTPTTSVLAYDPAADSWSELEPAPVTSVGLYYIPLIWTGTHLLVYVPSESAVLIYTPPA